MLELRNVTMSYEHDGTSSRVLDDVSLQLQQGEVVLLCGESGCGKTSVLSLINGVARYFFQAHVSGDVLLDGEVITHDEAYDIAQRIGSVFQNPKSQFFTLDVQSELAFGCENLGLEPTEIEKRLVAVEREFNMKNLGERSLVQLSGGEKQKIACAAVAAMEPQVLLLDEPSSNLDVGAIEELRRTVQRWKKQGKTILIAEHRLYYLADVIDRAIYMKGGRISSELTRDEFCALGDEDLHLMGLRSTRSAPEANDAGRDGEDELVMESFSFRYPGMSRPALNIDRLAVPKGRVIGIVGKNGAGKTTLVRSLAGLEHRAKGVLRCGEKVYDKPKKLLGHSYLVMQDVNHQLFGESVDSDIFIGSKRLSRHRVGDITEVLTTLNLMDKRERHPMSLSGGERQRVAIASALVSGRDILVFDEPTSGLDYRHMERVARQLEGLADQGITVFVVTHDVELLAQCCDFLLLIEEGGVGMARRCDTGVLGETIELLKE